MLLLTVWVAGVAAADGLRDLDRFTSRFYVIHTNLSKAEAVEYGVHMDLVYASYSKQFRALRGKKQDPQNLYLLRTHADYTETLRDIGIDASGSGGMFFWGGARSGLAAAAPPWLCLDRVRPHGELVAAGVGEVERPLATWRRRSS